MFNYLPQGHIANIAATLRSRMDQEFAPGKGATIYALSLPHDPEMVGREIARQEQIFAQTPIIPAEWVRGRFAPDDLLITHYHAAGPETENKAFAAYVDGRAAHGLHTLVLADASYVKMADQFWSQVNRPAGTVLSWVIKDQSFKRES